MSAGALHLNRIEPLSKENFETWKMQVEALLTKHDLWEYVSGTKEKPAVVTGSEEVVTANTKARAEWTIADKKAKSDLILSIHPTELQHVRGCDTSHQVWLKLESVFASKGPARKATLLKQLTLQKLEEGGDVRDHLSKFFDAVDKLGGMDVDVHKDLMSILLLYSLPASYENFRCAIESRDELPSAEILKVKIIEESEVRRQTSTIEIAGALAAGNHRTHRQPINKKNFSNHKSPTKFKWKCYSCGKKGHMSKDCKSIPSNMHGENSKPSANNVTDDTYAAFMAQREERGAEDVMSRPWILDSGATRHLCADRETFERLDESTSGSINLANNASSSVQGKGDVRVSIADGTDLRWVKFQNTLFVPELRSNLVSVAKITDKDHLVLFDRASATVLTRSGQTVMTATRRGDLYYVTENCNMAGIAESKINTRVKEWHERMGHLNAQDLLKIVTRGTEEKLTMNDMKCLTQCEVCLRGKMTTLPFPTSERQSQEILELVHTDVMGPFRVQAANGAKFVVTFVDDYSRWTEIFFLKQKSGVLEAFKLYQAQIERQTGKKIKCVQSDNGKEYDNTELNSLLERQGVARRFTVVRTPQQNGVAERLNRTLLDMTRCLLIQSGLPVSFWGEAMATASHIRNRCPSSSLKGVTPYEKLKNGRIDLTYLKTFGSQVYVLNKDPAKGKFADRSIKGIFVGYPRETKGYRVWLPEARKFVVARDVKFLDAIPEKYLHGKDEIVLLERNPENNGGNTEPKAVLKNQTFEDTPLKSQPKSPQRLGSPRNPSSTLTESDGDSSYGTPGKIQEDSPVSVQSERRGPGRPRLLRTGSRGRPRKLFSTRRRTEVDENDKPEIQINDGDDDVFANVAEVSIEEAMQSPESYEWKRAIQSEVESLVKNDTWEVVKSPESQHKVGSRIVLTNKCSADGSIERRKARIVAKGYSQRYGVDYYQTFAPVARMESVRMLLALAAEFSMEVRQFDVVTAYLNGKLEECVYMQFPLMLPEMLELIINDNQVNEDVRARASNMLMEIKQGANVCRLRKGIYGLKQAGRLWHARLSKKLKSIGLESTKGEPCMYHAHRDGNLLLLVIYVDDILMASTDSGWVDEVKEKLLEEFEIKDLGLAKHCLGLEINQGEDFITVTQSGYIQNILDTFGMNECNPISTPAEVQTKGIGINLKSGKEGKWPYRELIGSLMYLAIGTRPDIANTVSRLSQHTNDPGNQHWKDAKRLLRYLAGTKHLALKYTKTGDLLFGYSDADWGGCTSDRRSYTGYSFFMGGAAITWKSQKQRTVALSSTEAEYVSMSEATKEVLHLRSLLLELGLGEFIPITLYTDNRGAQQLASNSVYHARTKHIDIRHHFIREAIENELITIIHVPTDQMTSDILTKPLPRKTHWRCTIDLGLVDLSDC